MSFVRHAGLFCLELFLLTIVVSYAIVLKEQSFPESDFRVFYSAAVLLRTEPDRLYDFASQQKVQDRYIPPHLDMTKQYSAYLVYVYPPFYLLPFIPLTFLPPQVAYRIMQIVLVLVLVGAVSLLMRRFPPRVHMGRLWLGALAFAPVFESLRQTHIAGVVLLIFMGIYDCFKRKKYMLAGLLGSLLFYKAQLISVLLLYFILSRNKPAVAGLLAGSLVLGGISLFLLQGNVVPFFEMNFWYAFLHEKEAFKSITMLSWQGLFSAIEVFFVPSVSMRIFALVASIVTIFLVFVSIPRRIQETHAPILFSILIITTLVSGLHVHQYDGILLLFPLCVLYHTSSSWKAHTVAFLGWVIIFFNTFTYADFSPFYFLPAVYLAGVLLMGIVYLRKITGQVDH